ncbi:MAG: hypothetical protein KBD62_37660, partial [Kofleriaceae bacterium]|nr:hypothetical protein [Kofleriaceae bacterium]
MGAPPIVPQIAGAPNAAPSMPAPQPSIFETLSPEVLQGITGQPQAPAAPVQNSPDFAATPKVQPKTGQALAKDNKRYDAKQAQQAAYAASPEGKIANAEQGVMGAMDRQAEIAGVAGDVNAAEADANAAILDERNIELQTQQADIEATQKQREARLGELRTNHDKLVQAESSFKVDRGRKWANKSTGAKVAAGIAVAMTALGDALQYKSGPNLALQIIQQGIDDDVADQVRDFEQLGTKVNRARSSLDGYMKETGDIVASKQMLMAQRRLEAADEMEAVAAKFQSPKAKLQAEQNAAALRMEAQKYLGQSAESAFGREVQRGQLANARAQVGLGFANLRQQQEEFKVKYSNKDSFENRKLLLEAAQLDQAGNAAAAKALRDEATTNNELGMIGPAKPVLDDKGAPVVKADGTPEIRRDELLKNQDGTAWRAPKDTVRNELAKKMAVADQVTGIIDEVLAIRDRVGGESSAGNSDEFQRLKVLEKQLQILAKSGTQGMSSDEDMKALRDSLGAGDITSFRSRAAGLEEGRRRTVDAFNTAMKYEGNYSGERIDFPSKRDKDPILSSEDEMFKRALVDTRQEDVGKLTNERDYKVSIGKYGAADEQSFNDAILSAGYNADAKALVGNAERTLANPKAPPEQREKARALLKNISDKANNGVTRTKAAEALWKATQSDLINQRPVGK